MNKPGIEALREGLTNVFTHYFLTTRPVFLSATVAVCMSGGALLLMLIMIGNMP